MRGNDAGTLARYNRAGAQHPNPKEPAMHEPIARRQSRSRKGSGGASRIASIGTPIGVPILTIRRLVVIIVAILTTGIVAGAPAAASASVTLDGSFSTVILKPDFTSMCPSGVADECGTMQLVGLGAADWAYAFGPTFEPNGRCFDVDGTLTITLQADRSTISGPLTGLFCPRLSDTGHQHAGAISYGNPFVENDSIALSDGTGQFAGLSGAASFHTFVAGARFEGTLNGTLSG